MNDRRDHVTAGDVIADALVELGVRRVAGRPLGDLPVLETGDDELSFLLADCAGRIGGGWGAAFADGNVLHLSSQPGGTARPRTVTSVDGFVAALVEAELDTTPRTLAFELDLDLDVPVDDDLDLSGRPDGGVLVTLSPSLADLRIVAIVGPGAGRGHVDQLGEFAARGGIGVLNTFGAKGVFRWDSPFHSGTIGLQAGDLAHAGLDAADLVVTSGLDPAELDASALGGLLVQDLPPWQLAAALTDWPRAHRSVASRPPIYDLIAAIVTPEYERSDGTVTAARAALQLAGAAPDDGLVVADAGVAGFWLARTFPTGVPGSIVVPALRQPGFAVGAALVAGLDGRPCVAVVDGLGEVDGALVELAERLGVALAVQVWEPGGATTPAEHVELCRQAFGGAGGVTPVGVDTSAGPRLSDALGAVTAWGGVVNLDS